VPQSVQANASIRPWQIPTISIPIHYSSNILPFNRTVTELMTAAVKSKEKFNQTIKTLLVEIFCNSRLGYTKCNIIYSIQGKSLIKNEV
jgi:hypothetical protein